MMASTKGISEPWIALAESRSPPRTARMSSALRSATTSPTDADHTGGAAREVRQLEFIDPGAVGQRRTGHHGHRFEQVALGVLDRSDPGVAPASSMSVGASIAIPARSGRHR